MGELVSVIMPAYNAQETITESIQSVLSQSCGNCELIIIDDCSTDKTAAIIKSFADNRIRYVLNEKNLGVAASRNRAVELAQGEWIAFLDADDIWDLNKLSRQLEFANETDAKITYTASAFMDADGNRFDWVMPAIYALNYKELLKRNLMSCSSVMVRRELIKRYPFPNRPVTHEDYVVWLRILREVGTAYGLDEPLLIYRMSGQSKSANRVKSARMSLNAYREVEYNPIIAALLTVRYAKHSVSKRRKIKNGMKKGGD